MQNSEIETEEVEEVNPNQEGLGYENFQYNELQDGTLEIIDYKERGETEVIIPAEIEGKKVTSIGDVAFRGCSSLESVSIPEGVTEIGSYAFYLCSSLKEIMVSENNMMYTSENGILYNKDMTTLIYCPEGITGKVVIPEGVTQIEQEAFRCCNLISISIPEGVTQIGNYAFDKCNNNLTLIVTRGSYAETYAKKNHISYRYIGEPEGCTHNYTSEIIIEPSCNKRGIKLYTCTKCENTYIKAIPITDHTYQSKLTKATTKKNGNITTICSKCGAQKGKKTIIYAANTIKLSKPSVTYNNKVQKPSITIKDSKGKALKKDKDYTITYPKNMKNVGTYTITIQLKGNYKGNITKTFTITPKAVSITKITPKSKGFTVKWKKQTKQVTGYQISYSTSKNFAKKATKTKTISNAKATTKTISKLKAKKAYYIKIRPYKEVKVNGKMTKLYSNWSKVKTVTTKK